MTDLNITFIFSALLAGFFTFFAPCTFPLLPAFLAIIAGVKPEDIADESKLKKLRGKIFVNTLLYVFGFSIVFILFGAIFASLGQIVLVKELLQRFGGVLIIFLGLFLMGWLKISFLQAEKKISAPSLTRSASGANSFILGAVFALGWSPCIGPLLGSILFLASGSGTLLQGLILLIAFSLGLAIPFLITALLIGRAFSVFQAKNELIAKINMIAGIFLLFVGILLIFNQFSALVNWLNSYFVRFNFYEELINKFM